MLTSDGAQATAKLGIFAIKPTMQTSTGNLRVELKVICEVGGRNTRAMVILPRRQFHDSFGQNQSDF